MCRSPNSSANHGITDGTRSVPTTFVGNGIPLPNHTGRKFAGFSTSRERRRHACGLGHILFIHAVRIASNQTIRRPTRQAL